MESIPYEIVSIIASMNTDITFYLRDLYELLQNSEYDPEFYCALKYKKKTPKVTILIHKNGKIIFCGAKSFKEIEIAKKNLFEDLKRIGYIIQDNPIHVDNLVLVGNLNETVDLDMIAALSNDIKYRPELFPGLFFKNKNPKFTAILFKSGKFTITGLNDEHQIPYVLTLIRDRIKNFKRNQKRKEEKKKT